MVKLTINGKARTLELDPQMLLLRTLRDHAGLTGTKYSCGMAHCGSCTVFLDGDPVRACVTPVWAAAGKAVTTIEGLDTPAIAPAVANAVFAATGQRLRELPLRLA